MKSAIGLLFLIFIWSCERSENPVIDDGSPNELLAALETAVELIKKGEYSQAKYALREADSMSRSADNDYARSSVLSNYGWLFYKKAEYDSSIAFYQKALDIDHQLADSVSLMRHLRDLGRSYRAQASYSLATEAYEQALVFAKYLNDSTRIAYILNSLGNVLLELEDYDGAQEYYINAEQAWQNLGHQANYAIALQNEAFVLIEKDSVENAIEVLLKVLQVKESLNRQLSKAYTLNALGSAFLKAGKPALAQDVLEQAFIIRDSAQDRSGIAETTLLLGRVSLVNGQFKKAEKLINTAKNEALLLSKADLYRDALIASKQLLRQIGKFKAALEIDDALELITDSLYRIQRLEVQGTQSVYRLAAEKQRTVLAEQSAQMATLAAEINKRESNLRLWLFVSAALAIVIISWQLRRIKQKNSSLESLNSHIKKITDSAFHSQANAIGLLSAIIRSQIRQLQGREQELLVAVNQKVDALSVLTQQVFQLRLADQHGITEQVDFKRYLEVLIEETLHSIDDGSFTTEMDLSSVPVSPKVALNLGLVVNELITNSIKYAGPQGAKRLIISSKVKGNQLELVFADDGPGYEPNRFEHTNGWSFGRKMIDSLIEKDLKGSIDIASSKEGMFYQIIVKL